MINFYRYQLPLLIWALIIFIFSSIKTLPSIELPIISADKLAHMFIYFIFCWLSYRALFFQNRSILLKRWSIVGAFLLSCLYGFLDEVHQLFVPGRSYEFYDMLANAIGAFLFIIIFALSGRYKQQQRDAG